MECDQHTLVSHIAVLHHNSVLLLKYDSGHDDQKGWFLPNDGLKHLEHPEQGARRVLKEHLGISDATLKLVEIESFQGNTDTWHLIFDYLAFPRTMNVAKGPRISEARWFEIDKLPPAAEFAHHGWGRSVLQKHAIPLARPQASI